MIRLLSFVMVGLTLTLGACSTDQTKGPTYPVVGTVDQTKLEQSAFAARSAYAGILRFAAEYASLPRCGTATSPPVCSSQGAVDEMRRLDNSANTATAGAVELARNPSRTASALANAVTDAQRAVELFRNTVAVYKPQAKDAS